jgi:hypothetical protein
VPADFDFATSRKWHCAQVIVILRTSLRFFFDSQTSVVSFE